MNQELKSDQCLQTLDEVLYANLDVTTNAMAWSFLLLAQHGDIQERLREEIKKHKVLTKADWHSYINRSDTLLAYSVLEASRLHPVLRKIVLNDI